MKKIIFYSDKTVNRFIERNKKNHKILSTAFFYYLTKKNVLIFIMKYSTAIYLFSQGIGVETKNLRYF